MFDEGDDDDDDNELAKTDKANKVCFKGVSPDKKRSSSWRRETSAGFSPPDDEKIPFSGDRWATGDRPLLEINFEDGNNS